MPTVRDRALCLRRLDWSETSQIVVLMTAEHGKVSATAKGAKRRTPSTLAKFSGGIDLLTGGEAVMILKSGVELANLIEWDLSDPYWHLRRDLSAHRLGMYGADLVHHIVQDSDPHPRTFKALTRFLADVADPDDQDAALLRFQLDVIGDMGYRPVLDRDAQTQQTLDESADTLAFSARAGGLVADTGASDRWRVRRETVDILRSAEKGDELNAAPEAIARANRLLCVYLRAILDKQLPTMEFLLGSS